MKKFARLDLVGITLLLLLPALIGLFAAPTYERLTKRKLLLGGMSAAREVVDRARRFHYQYGRLPGHLAQIELGGNDWWPANVAEVALEADGSVAVTYRGDPAIDGRHVRFERFSQEDGSPGWRCVTPDLPGGWLPEMCDVIGGEEGQR